MGERDGDVFFFQERISFFLLLLLFLRGSVATPDRETRPGAASACFPQVTTMMIQKPQDKTHTIMVAETYGKSRQTQTTHNNFKMHNLNHQFKISERECKHSIAQLSSSSSVSKSVLKLNSQPK